MYKDYPSAGDEVEIVSNETMKVVCGGILMSFSNLKIALDNPFQRYPIIVCAKTHHFQGYEPKELLVDDHENGGYKIKGLRSSNNTVEQDRKETVLDKIEELQTYANNLEVEYKDMYEKKKEQSERIRVNFLRINELYEQLWRGEC